MSPFRRRLHYARKVRTPLSSPRASLTTGTIFDHVYGMTHVVSVFHSFPPAAPLATNYTVRARYVPVPRSRFLYQHSYAMPPLSRAGLTTSAVRVSCLSATACLSVAARHRGARRLPLSDQATPHARVCLQPHRWLRDRTRDQGEAVPCHQRS